MSKALAQPSRRRAGLTFQHHVEVAALPPQEQDHWPDFAARLGWSRNDLRRQIRASYDSADSAALAEQVRVNLSISAERMERWERAAARDKRWLIDWIATVLDEVAAEEQS